MPVVQRGAFGLTFNVIEPATLGLPKHSLWSFEDHEPVLQHWCENISPGDVVIDAGACFGSYTLPALAKGARVIAYEPFEDAIKILTANVAANGWQDRFELVPAALWDGSEYPAALKAEVFGASYPATQLDVVTLDAEVARLGLSHVDWLKSDVEGAELGLLMGAVATLQSSRPTCVIEDHDNVLPNKGVAVSDYPASVDSSRRIHRMLAELGYRIEDVLWTCDRRYLVATYPSTRS